MFSGLFQPTHLILILVVVLIVFGPGKLPEAGRALGKAMKDMRDAVSSFDENEEKDKKDKLEDNNASTTENTAQQNTNH